MIKIPTVEEMLKAGLHFGHRTSKWYPKMEPFIFGSKNGIHIIDLNKAQTMLGTALEYMAKMTSEGKIILFVGSKEQVKKPLKKMAESIGMPYVTERWLGGLLTNYVIIKKSIRKYQDLLEKKNSGQLEKYTKKERLEFDREIKRLEIKFGGLVALPRLPDAIFIWDIKKEETALNEAWSKNIPVIAICDTNVNPDNINYVIPANDDASKGITLILGFIEEAILEGKKTKVNSN